MVLPNDENVIEDPPVFFDGTIDNWIELAQTYASIAIDHYINQTGQSTDRRAFVLTMSEIQRVAIDVLAGQKVEAFERIMQLVEERKTDRTGK